MRVIGVTGPTGAGKSTVLAVGEALGGLAIDCDQVYARLLEESAPLRAALSGRFGPVFGPEGQLDRCALSEVVFSDPAALAELNRITHGFVKEEVGRLLARARAEGVPFALVEAIALIESGLADWCDVVVGILAPRELRLARIQARENMPRQAALRRIEAQRPDAFFEQHCQYILRSGGEREAFSRQAEQLISALARGETDEGGHHMSETEKTLGEQRREALLYRQKNGYDLLPEAEVPAMEAYCEDYKAFLNAGKTERLCVAEAVRLAEERGFRPLVRGMALQPGDKVYRVNRGKAVMLAVLGQAPLSSGAAIGAAHIDSPRLDLKPNPLYEDSELALLKTHYYGGIRKYQWVAIPLELRGVVALKDGSVLPVDIGAAEGDPRLTITDLLPHLADEQAQKPLHKAITGEQLNLLVGSRPLAGDSGSDRVKLTVLELLHQKYGITEADLLSAELCAVPAFPAVDIGLDRSMIGAYGQDDRVCTYAALRALLEVERPARTAVCMLADKEEIGSVGVSGMRSAAFDTFMSDLCDGQGVPLKACYEASFCLSADVTAALDPTFPEVSEKRNAARVNYGLGFCKYTGSRGKSGASDASAEVVAYARRLMDEAGVVWQMAELGKVDQGGGGTVAGYMANRNIDTLDAGVPVLAMHAPFEITGKLDCYMNYKGMRAVYEAK